MTDAAVERKDKMKLVNLADIIVGDRFRKDFGDMDEFVASIKEKGIIQPITVDQHLNLLAGGRRYAGATAAGLHKIPCIIRDFVDEIDSREIELIENVYRKDFTWQERDLLVKKINDLYKAKDPEWSGRDTAKLLDKSVGGVSNSLQRAEYLAVIPELQELKTADEANKFIKKLEGDMVVEELRKRQKASMEKPTTGSDSATALKRMLKIADGNYNIGDCFEGMKGLKTNGNITFIECDPPYGIDLSDTKAGRDSVGSTVTGYKEVPSEEYESFLGRLTSELFRVASKDCWMVFWFGPSWHQSVLNSLRGAGWQVDEIPAIWVKVSGQTQQPQVHLARSYEPFFVCRKGQPVLNKPGRLNTFQFPGCPTMGPNAKYHPTQRPVELIEELLETFTVGQQIVFVPFLGSGATLRACYNKGVLGYGYDLNGTYKDKFMLAVEQDSRKNLS